MSDELSVESERALARSARAGDDAARERLIRAGLPWVAMHAARLGFTGAEYDDAIQDGAVGLIDAVDRFDPGRDVRLVSFAWAWIEGAMRRGRSRARTHVTMPWDAADDLPDDAGSSAARVLSPPEDEVLCLRFGFRDGRVWTRAEVAAHLGWTPAQVRHHEVRVLSHLRARVANIGLRAHT